MIVKITQAKLKGEIKAIASKSYAHRLLIGAALADWPTQILCRESSADIDATCDCLKALCAGVERDAGVFRVIPREPSSGSVLRCGESGSTFRFLLPVTCALGADSAFLLSGGLTRRPMAPLYAALEAHGIEISGRESPFISTAGKLKGGRYRLPGDVSSQFISGLLFALPLLSQDSVIEISGKPESKAYIDMTLSALERFGIHALSEPGEIRVPGKQRYRSPQEVSVEGDWSNAAFWLCAAAIGGGPVACANLDADSLQGDKAIVEILGRFGAKVEWGRETATVCGDSLHGIEIDVKNIPDLVPALAAVAAFAQGQTRFVNAGRLRLKESDRLESVACTLNALGGDVIQSKDGLLIKGKKELRGGSVHSCGDHRIAMMAAIAAVGCDGPVMIEDAQAVEKSYPGFFDDYMKLGGIVESGE